VYAREGNEVVIHVVDPIRRVACKLPWWVTKYGVALPLALPYYAYANAVRAAADGPPLLREVAGRLPLSRYSQWIARRPFPFFHHVAFDQLVTPRTVYLSRADVDGMLAHRDVDPASTYVVQRNGNSWKFGGRKREG
jgi:hypothetical protein